MYTLLRNDAGNQSEILRHTLVIADKYLQNAHDGSPGVFVSDLPLDDVPLDGRGAINTLRLFETRYLNSIPYSTGPRYFGFVTGGSTPASLAADWLVSTFDQNTCCANDSIAPQIERLTIHYMKQLFGLDPLAYGAFVTGATMANFVGLAQARQWVGEQHGVDVAEDGLGSFPLKVLSGSAHSSIVKAMAMAGIGRRMLEPVPTLPGREAVDVSALEKVLRACKQPVIVVANSGTVNSGDFDDLEAIAALKDRHRFWLHVDAAFGGFAACSPQYAHLVKGLHHGDSVTVDAHKWMNVPYDTAMQFTRHPLFQLKIFRNSASYLTDPEKSHDFFHFTPESSRRWRALPVWFSLQAYGKRGHAEIVERNCRLARILARHIADSEEFELLNDVRLNIVCFTIRQKGLESADIAAFLAAVRDDGIVYFTPTHYEGKPAIRAAISNWQTEERDIDISVESLKRVFARQKKE